MMPMMMMMLPPSRIRRHAIADYFATPHTPVDADDIIAVTLMRFA